MTSFKLFNRRAGSLFAVAAIVLSAAMPAITPAFVSAEQVTERSIQLSSASAGATGVNYTVSFKTVGATSIRSFIVEFCSNSPLYGEDCTAPSGLNVTTPTTSTADFTAGKVTSGNNNIAQATKSSAIATGETVTVAFGGLTNPSAADDIYARIVTFDTEAHADDYVSNPVEPAVNTGKIDDGGVALSIVPSIGVSGVVLESMTFCVSGETIGANCVGTGAAAPALAAPTVKLGTVIGDNTVLDAADTYEGTIYTQISTNAAGGAVVRLKSSALGCGGLVRAGAASNAAGCGIAAAGAGGASLDGLAQFGVKLGTAAGVGTSNGTVRAFDSGSGAFYTNSAFKLNYDSVGEEEGITSTYGDPILDTDGTTVNNMGMPLTFGASASNSTPAGRYSADLSLIATGTF